MIQTTSLPVSAYLMGIKTAYRDAEMLAKLERDRTAYLCDMFYRGKHRVYLSPIDGWIKEIPKKPGQPSIYHPENYFGALSDANVTEIVRAQPEFVVRASGEAARRADAARGHSALATYYQRQLFGETFKHGIAKRCQHHGTVAVYIWWDPQLGHEMEASIVEEVLEKPMPDAFICRTCRHQGPAESLVPRSSLRGPGGLEAMEDTDEPICPYCGSEDLQHVIVPERPGLREVGSVKFNSGDIGIEQVPIYELNVNGAARQQRRGGQTRFTNLYWLNRTTWLDRAAGHRLHPGLEGKWAPAGAGSEWSGRGQQIQQELQRTSGGTQHDRTGRNGTGSERLVEYSRDWFPAETYAEYTATVSHQLWDAPDAQWIEQGQALSEIFPDGIKMCCSGSNVLGMVAEDPAKHWRFLKWKEDPESFWGIPVVDAVPLQILLNESQSLITTNQMSNETPRLIYNRLAIKRAELFSNPTSAIPYDTLPEGMSARDILFPIPSLPLGPGAYSRPADIRRSMQTVFGSSFLGASGEAGAENMKTAASWSIAQDRSMAKAGTHMALLGEGYAGVLELVLYHFATNASDERFIEIQGEDYAEPELLAVRGADLSRDVEITVKKGSAVPRADYQLRDDWNQYHEWEAAYMQTHGQEPPLVTAIQAAERFGVPVGALPIVIAGRVTRLRLDALKKVAPMVPQIAEQRAMARMEEMATSAPAIGPDGMPIDPRIMQAMAAMEIQSQMASLDGMTALALEHLLQDPASPVAIRRNGDRHALMAQWLERWESTDEGIKADPGLVALVEGYIDALNAAANQKMAAGMAGQAAIAQSMAPPVDDEQDSDEMDGPKAGPSRDTSRERTAARRAAPRGRPSQINH